MASVTIDVDLPPGVEITGYERYGDGPGFEVRWPLPEHCRCERCGHEDWAHIEFKTTPQAVKCAPEFGHENGGAFRTRTHALAECFSLHWPSNSAGVKYPSDE